ncbi:polysaccharide pyruvyl transferase [Mycobacterium sp. PS03-16]|uniref:polysaccharide pyruvyl transferase family protein n=1 Tax=Mycobacterium sp. PS03-16 TaxID=2559611 RepID=UPI0010744DC0|nr:polysaccharide pyruvyl transferase family protein [Mycobacterium sp. PS03-16]TFV60685.1 polysaccharide pyruvyl transferase [Mycobacterium sp. PS03-16]
MAEFLEWVRTQLITQVSPFLPHGGDCDMVDFPHHLNCGDSAIWLGVQRLAAQRSVTVRSTTTASSYRPDRLRASGPIVINGGGNLGGLYPVHDDLRRQVIHDFPDRPIVQMPQSVQIADRTRLEDLKRAIGAHRDVTLLVRDRRSLAIAEREFDCRTLLAPDAAFALGALVRRPPRTELVVQARRDGEAASGQLADIPTVDWTQAPMVSTRNLGWSLANVAGKSGRPRPSRAAMTWFARRNLDHAVDILSQGRRLVTDRLHGHVIAVLCGIPHTVINDRHGKIEELWHAWTRRAPNVTFMPTWSAWRASQSAPTVRRSTG